MKFFKKNSIIGFVIGFVLSPLILAGGFYIFSKAQMSNIVKASFPPPEIPINQKATFDWNVKNLDGNEFRLKDALSNQVVFLNFWATWCPPCLIEMPSMEKLYQHFGGRVLFVCISDEEIETLKKFIKTKEYTFPIYAIKDKPPKVFNSDGIPATFIISKNKNIVLKHIGGADWAHENVIDFIEKLLIE